MVIAASIEEVWLGDCKAILPQLAGADGYAYIRVGCQGLNNGVIGEVQLGLDRLHNQKGGSSRISHCIVKRQGDSVTIGGWICDNQNPLTLFNPEG